MDKKIFFLCPKFKPLSSISISLVLSFRAVKQVAATYDTRTRFTSETATYYSYIFCNVLNFPGVEFYYSYRYVESLHFMSEYGLDKDPSVFFSYYRVILSFNIYIS